MSHLIVVWARGHGRRVCMLQPSNRDSAQVCLGSAGVAIGTKSSSSCEIGRTIIGKNRRYMIQQRGVDGGRVRRPDVAMAGPRQQAALPRPGKLNVGRFELSRSSKNELERLEERYWKQFSVC